MEALVGVGGSPDREAMLPAYAWRWDEDHLLRGPPVVDQAGQSWSRFQSDGGAHVGTGRRGTLHRGPFARLAVWRSRHPETARRVGNRSIVGSRLLGWILRW